LGSQRTGSCIIHRRICTITRTSQQGAQVSFLLLSFTELLFDVPFALSGQTRSGWQGSALTVPEPGGCRYSLLDSSRFELSDRSDKGGDSAEGANGRPGGNCHRITHLLEVAFILGDIEAHGSRNVHKDQCSLPTQVVREISDNFCTYTVRLTSAASFHCNDFRWVRAMKPTLLTRY